MINETETVKSFDQLKKKTVPYAQLGDKLMLDTGSTINATIKNKDFLTDIRTSKNPIVMATNAGMKRMNLDGDLAGFGVAKYDSEQIANILGFSHMADKYKISYDNSVEDAFLVHTENGIVKFSRDGRLYTYEPSEKFMTAIAEYKGQTPSGKKLCNATVGTTTTDKINSTEEDAYYYLDLSLIHI